MSPLVGRKVARGFKLYTMAKVKEVFYHLKTGVKYYPRDDFKDTAKEVKRLTDLGKLEKPKTKKK